MNIKRIKEKHAKKFKKIVHKVEKLKWKLIKKYDKNYLKRNERLLKKQRDKLLQQVKTEEERKKIISNYKSSLLLINKEYNSEKNINYHLDMLDPNSTINYLKNNKKIHKSWLIVDSILLASIGLSTVVGLGSNIFVPIIGLVCLEAIKNLECMNLQDYCIDKVNQRKKTVERRQQKIINEKSNKYGSAQSLIYQKVKEGKDVVSTKDLINAIDNQDIEALKQIKELLSREASKRKNMENGLKKELLMKKGGQ